jgi:Protein of unknown function (DUF2844)
MKVKPGIFGVLLLLTLALPFSAAASLGGGIASVEADRAKLQGTMRSASAEAFTVQTIEAPGGAVVKEYVSAAGNVFGVAWRGPWRPDLRQLLGAYFDQFTKAVQAERKLRRGRGPLLVQQPGLVVQMSGHPRSFWGRAYLPQMLPAGVRAEDMQ